MDPLTAGLNTLNTLLQFAMKIYDVTPEPLKVQGAADWAKFIHNISDSILSLQAQFKVLPK